ADFVTARKTRSSTATVRVNTVAEFAPEMPTAAPEPLMAGPAGLPGTAFVSPGRSEMRVVFGVHDPAAPRQVSRTKTCRKPLLDCAFAPDEPCDCEYFE